MRENNYMKKLYEDIEKELIDKFVEPMASEMRAMNLNSEPHIMASAKEMKIFLLSALSRQLDEIAKIINETKKEMKENHACRFNDGEQIRSP